MRLHLTCAPAQEKRSFVVTKRERCQAGGRRWHAPAIQPQAQIQITPLIDVLLVLLVLGALVGARSAVTGRANASASPTTDALQGVSLPIASRSDAARSVSVREDSVLIGLGLQGRLSWRGVPVTRDILARQLKEVLLHDSQAEVWLAIDQELPYADVLSWLAWLQAQQVTRLTLLSHAQPSARAAGKP